MITILFDGSFTNLIAATEKANALLRDDKFYQLIGAKEKFDFSNATPDQIAASIKKCVLTSKVVTYKKLFPLKTLGFETPEDPLHIHINMLGWRGKRSVASYTGTIIHEAVHCADSDSSEFSFGHDGNSASGNENTAPYWIGNLAINMVVNPLLSTNDLPNLFAEAHALESDESLA